MAPGRDGAQKGAALLVVLTTVALLTVVVMEFTFTVQVGHRRTAHWIKSRQTRLLAESGLLLAGRVLALDAALTKVDSLDEPWALELPEIDAAGAGTLILRIEDETSRYNLNRLRTGSTGEIDRAQRLFEGIGLDPALVAPIVDWVDADDLVLEFPAGAEEGHYRDLLPPYLPRNAPLRTLRELALVKGIGSKELITLARIANTLSLASRRVNINTAGPQVLRALHPRMDDDSLIERILEERRLRPFTTRADMARVEGLNEIPIAPLVAFRSSRFRVRSTASNGGIFSSLEALVARSGLHTEVIYRLYRPGPIIRGVDTSAPTRLNDPPWEAVF
jgi:type II secretory pathway component PulK